MAILRPQFVRKPHEEVVDRCSLSYDKDEKTAEAIAESIREALIRFSPYCKITILVDDRELSGDPNTVSVTAKIIIPPVKSVKHF